MVTTGLKPSNFKEWLGSAKVITTILWILFPLAYITAVYILDLGVDSRRPNMQVGPLIIDIPFETESAIQGVDFVYGPPIPFMAVLLLFSLIPVIYPTDKYFKKRGSKNIVMGYLYIRKILFGYLFTLIALVIMLYFVIPDVSSYLGNLRDQGMSYDEAIKTPIFSLVWYLFLLTNVLLSVPIFILLKLLLTHASKQFRFYFAKACFEIIYQTASEPDKPEYLRLGLAWYNNFVKGVTKRAIDIETIYSKIISLSQLSNSIVLDNIADSFHNGDELKPVRHMMALLSRWKEGEATLVKESLRTEIKESSDLLIPIVTVIITVITTFFLRPTA